MKQHHIVKVCGLREPDNVRAISQLPVDWLGVIFHPDSPRHVLPDEQLESALREAAQLKVGVFVRQSPSEVAATAQYWQLDMVQLHGDQSVSFCQALKALMPDLPLIKVFRIDAHFDFTSVLPFAPLCRYVLFDTRATQMGGTGKRFDWSLLQHYRMGPPFILSGGIGPEAVATLAQVMDHPLAMGIDLNSRFEVAPARKDVSLLDHFLQQLGKKQYA